MGIYFLGGGGGGGGGVGRKLLQHEQKGVIYTTATPTIIYTSAMIFISPSVIIHAISRMWSVSTSSPGHKDIIRRQKIRNIY